MRLPRLGLDIPPTMLALADEVIKQPATRLWVKRRNSDLDQRTSALEHDPEKWMPVFPRDKRGTRLRGDHAQTKS
jgi:hypothetical protein